MGKYFRIILATGLFIVVSCKSDISHQKDKSSNLDKSIFSPVENCGIEFRNTIRQTLTMNTIVNDGILQGGGVGILDVNNDGLQDIYFAGNQVTDRLYLNLGNLKFKDISSQAGINKDKNWSMGVSIVDINGDGYDDIYVCKYLYDDPEKRRNVLYVNSGHGTFTEKASDYGIDDTGYSVMANFFDYDQDGDLDLYVANQPPYTKELRKKLTPTDYQYTDRLYRNDHGKYTDVTNSSGIKNVTYSLSATTTDFDNDGYIDIYVACDYEEPDILYHNNGDGTFTDIIHKAIKHMSNFGMGSDVADIDNDGYMDVFVADMVADDNFRNKTNMASMAVEKFWSLVKAGYHYQYMFNSLQLNNGNGTYSEIAQMAGVSKTDWSWAPLFIDADLDGYKDLFVTNGIIKDIRNKDYMKTLKKKVAEMKKKHGENYRFDPIELSNMAPSVKIKNRSYRNTGNLIFENTTSDWGFGMAGWSQGMAYADLDNDGDLDIVINNSNDKASLLKNTVQGKNWLIVKVSDKYHQNNKGIGSRVIVKYGKDKTQMMDITPYRGYTSSCEPLAHFGMEDADKIDEIEVVFPDGKVKKVQNVKANQSLTIDYDPNLPKKMPDHTGKKLFTPLPNIQKIVYIENAYDDYAREVLIPYKTSYLGPHMAVGDVDGDGNDDFYLSGAASQAGQLFLGTGDGKWKKSPQKAFEIDKNIEDGGAKFIDVDSDGDMDLYVASGGSEYPLDSKAYIDRLYINKEGVFINSKAIPEWTVSTHAIAPYDVNNDGKVDIFVGGRLVPGQYGKSAPSKLLLNDGEKYVTTDIPLLDTLGMVTGADWADVLGNGKKELIVSGEWMPIQIYQWKNNSLTKMKTPALSKYSGLWNTVKAYDIDNDGDMDLVAGNYGLNYKYKVTPEKPFELYVKDFDNSGTNDVYLGYHDEKDGKLYPVRGRQCSSEQMPYVKDKFANYEEFGKATVFDVLEDKIKGATIRKATTLANMIFLNDGKGHFSPVTMPMRAQVAPIYDIAFDDFDNDGSKDFLAIGNFYQREVETTRSDAGIGVVVKKDNNGKFSVIHPSKTGIIANNDARALGILKTNSGKKYIAIANNGSEMQFYQY